MMKTVRFVGVVPTLFFLVSLLACTTKSVDTAGSEPCPNTGKFVKKVKSITGQVNLDSTRQQYFIQRAIPGTYDSVDVGYVCNLPEAFWQAGLQVEFSGSYYENDDVPASFGGFENYYLTVTKIAKVP